MASATERVQFKHLQELGGLEMVDANFCHYNFSKHCHDTYSINVIEKGAQVFDSAGIKYIAPERSIIIVNADEVHTGQSASQAGWSYRGLSPTPAQFTQLAEDVGLASGFAPYFPQAVIEDSQMANQLSQLFTTLALSDNPLLRETMLYGVLTRLMLKHGKTSKDLDNTRTSNVKMEWVRQYIQDNLNQQISLEQLATLTDFSPFYLVRQFQKRYGLPPHAYQIQHRLRKSKTLLRQGHKVVDVATDIGFYDQSHFHRHFKRANGVTPSNYARQVAS